MTIGRHQGLRDDRRRSDRNTQSTGDDLVGVVVRLMPDAAIIVDDNGEIVAANALAETVFGYAQGELQGKGVDLLVPDRFRSVHSQHRDTYTARPTPRPMGGGLELLGRRRDGSEFPVDISLAPLGVPERPLTLAAIRDLTQRRAEWAALGRLAAIVSASDDAIVSADLHATVTSWNPGAQRLFGYRADEMVGRPIFRLVPGQRRSEAEEQLARVRGGLRISPHDTRRLRKNGEEIDVTESVSLIREPSGEPIGFAVLMADITERKLAELELRRLLAESQRRERWLEALSDIRLSLLAGGGLADWLELIAGRVCELVDTDSSGILLRNDDDGVVSLAACVGEAFGDPSEEGLWADRSLCERIVETGETWTSSDLASEADAPVSEIDAALVGPLVAAPLTTSQGVTGVLAVAREKGRAPFEREDVKMVESFAQQAGVAVEISRAQGDREQLTLVADRERIARDLHDHVIQRLFAVGMALQAAAHSITDSRALERIGDSVEELDATIRGVRSTIFSLELRATERVETSARSQVLEIASKAAAGLGFQPRLQFDGPVDTRVPDDIVPEMLAVVREALSNVARHARASSVEVRVHVHDDLEVSVIDDGEGIGRPTRFSGLANLKARAERLGGTMSVKASDKGGTRVTWQVPIPYS